MDRVVGRDVPVATFCRTAASNHVGQIGGYAAFQFPGLGSDGIYAVVLFANVFGGLVIRRFHNWWFYDGRFNNGSHFSGVLQIRPEFKHWVAAIPHADTAGSRSHDILWNYGKASSDGYK